MRVRVTTYGWYGDSALNLVFPKNWKVTVHRMAGHDAPVLAKDQILRKLAKPVGTQALRDLAKGRKECVIIVDDLTRPTKASQIIPPILHELREAGLENDHIRFVMALGSHHWMRLDDICKKLGKDIPERYNVFNHNVYENHVFVGKTSYGTPVYINREVMKCDLKIGIGSIIPHTNFGFGGGAKIILPGVASIDTIHHNHSRSTGKVGQESNTRRLDAEEAARLAGLDFIANALVNPKRDCCELVCGDPVEAHRKGIGLARSHYVTETAKADVVVANTYPLESEAFKSFNMIRQSSKDKGDAVILIHTPEGLRGHYFNGRFGTDFGGKGWKPAGDLSKSLGIERTFAVAPYSSLAEHQYFGPASRWVKSWNDALGELNTKYSKSETDVAVYPYATIQMSREDKSAPQ